MTSLSLFTFLHWRRKWQSTPVFLPGESQGRGSLVGCRLWGCTESDMTEVTQQQQQQQAPLGSNSASTYFSVFDRQNCACANAKFVVYLYCFLIYQCIKHICLQSIYYRRTDYNWKKKRIKTRPSDIAIFSSTYLCYYGQQLCGHSQCLKYNALYF